MRRSSWIKFTGLSRIFVSGALMASLAGCVVGPGYYGTPAPYGGTPYASTYATSPYYYPNNGYYCCGYSTAIVVGGYPGWRGGAYNGGWRGGQPGNWHGGPPGWRGGPPGVPGGWHGGGPNAGGQGGGWHGGGGGNPGGGGHGGGGGGGNPGGGGHGGGGGGFPGLH
jgi:hypothetical protein